MRIKKETGVRTLDISKRLLDYGFHPPTNYFPLIVDEALMVEPTETESKETLDAFADALIAIAKEAYEDPEMVKSAPHNTIAVSYTHLDVYKRQNQALNALAATVYLSWLGKEGIREVGEQCVQKAHYLADRISAIKGFGVAWDAPFFHEFAAVSYTHLDVYKRQPITVYGDDYPTPDGTPVRDYVHVADLAQAHVLALNALDTGAQTSVINLGSDKGYSVMEVIREAERITGRPVPYVIGPRRQGDPATLVASSEKARTMLGWAPRLSSLEDIIGTAWKWHLKCAEAEKI